MAVTETTVLKVPGMSCGHCSKAITQAVGGLAGVANVDVNLDSKLVTVAHDPATIPVSKIREAIEDQGYDIE